MNFLEKAKKKQAELKAQYDKVSKELSNFSIGDKSKDGTDASKASPATTTTGSSATGAPQAYAELDSTPVTTSPATATSASTPLMTPATTTASTISEPPPSSATVTVAPRKTAKLTLVQRKDARDVWETSGKPELEERLSKVLGAKWTLDGDAAYLLNIKEDGVAADISTPGAMIKDYMSSAVRRIEELVDWLGKDTAYEINVLTPQKIISLEIDTEIIKEVPPDQYNRADFYDGRLRILIHRDHLWSNTPGVFHRFERTMLAARAENDQLKNEIDFVCKHGIRKEWEQNIDPFLEQTREILDDPGFNFDPRFQNVWQGIDTYAKTKPGKKKTQQMLWPELIGGHMFSYYLTFVNKLKDEKFEDDEMLQITLKESVPKRVAAFRLVEQTGKKSHELAIEDGVLYLQTTAENFLNGSGPIADNLMEII